MDYPFIILQISLIIYPSLSFCLHLRGSSRESAWSSGGSGVLKKVAYNGYNQSEPHNEMDTSQLEPCILRHGLQRKPSSLPIPQQNWANINPNKPKGGTRSQNIALGRLDKAVRKSHFRRSNTKHLSKTIEWCIVMHFSQGFDQTCQWQMDAASLLMDWHEMPSLQPSSSIKNVILGAIPNIICGWSSASGIFRDLSLHAAMAQVALMLEGFRGRKPGMLHLAQHWKCTEGHNNLQTFARFI